MKAMEKNKERQLYVTVRLSLKIFLESPVRVYQTTNKLDSLLCASQKGLYAVAIYLIHFCQLVKYGVQQRSLARNSIVRKVCSMRSCVEWYCEKLHLHVLLSSQRPNARLGVNGSTLQMP